MAEEFIGNYRILKKIGAGGMAKVYLAVHKDVPNLKVVLKVLGDPRLADRFRQEADKLALLDGHESVCRIKHFFNHGDDFVIAMEFIDGSSLEDVIKGSGAMPIPEALTIASALLETLEFAHQKDIFHRDIKPGNIMVDTRGQVKIIDFGIAKGKTDPNLTIAGTSCGTPAYMAPEQFNPTDDLDYASVDIYAAGTTLYHMLTGQLPFKGDNQFALRDAKMFNDPPNPRDLNPAIDKELADIIVKALAKEPKDRYSSAADMKAAVDRLRKDVPVPDLTSTMGVHTRPAEAVKTPKPKSPTSKKPMMIIAAAVVVVVIVVAGYLMFGGESAPTGPVAPQLVSPTQQEILEQVPPTFIWRSAGDENIAYIFECATDSAFTAFVDRQTVGDTQFVSSAEFAGGDYYWRITTMTRDGQRSEPSAAFAFSLPGGETAGAMLTVRVNPSGDIYLDDQLVASNQSEASLAVEAGEHVVKAVNKDARTPEQSRTVVLSEGADDTLLFRFTFAAANQTSTTNTKKRTTQPPKPDSGDVVIGSWPTDGGVIFIDGVLQDLRTNNTFRLPVGKHIVKVILTLDGVELEKIDSVVISGSATEKLRFNFEE
jgi:serine/threonine protein kinase